MLAALVTGFGVSLSLILAIGAQNAFVLRQGLLREHVFWVCLVCAMSDAVLIASGVAGMGALIAAQPVLNDAMLWGGALFLVLYGAFAVQRAIRPGRLLVAERPPQTLTGAIGTVMALTWLNPHVYLDTVLLVGSISVPFTEAGQGLAFAIGAISASFAFFFSLGYGARLLTPFFAKPVAWRALDASIAVVMWSIAAKLIHSAVA